MANGRVCIGFSKPYVALYSNSGTTVTYTSGMALARGVDVTLSPESSSDNVFYADNVAAESDSGRFTGGTVSLTVDGLKDAANALILGLPAAETVTVGQETIDVYAYGDAQETPYVGIGFVAEYMEDGVISYVPTCILKTKFQQPETSAATMEDSVDWQTQSLTADIFRDDTTAHNWKKVGEGVATEAKAEAVIKAIFGIS